MSPEVSITLKTIDESSDKVKKVKQEYEGLLPGLEKAGKGVGDFVSKNATLIGILAGTGAALKGAYDAFQNYAGSVRDLAAVSGTGAEEASRLLQVLDDYQLTAQDVTAATRFMTKAGLTPTIETLAQLSDQYNAINDPMEKNEFILQNLGKGGLQWVNVLKQGGDALRAQSEEVSKSLILTDEQIEKAEKARLAMDSLADAWEGVKVSIGSAIGELIAGAAATEELRAQFEELGMASEAATSRMDQGTNPAFERFRKTMEKGAAMTDYYNSQMQANTDATMDNAEAQKAAEESSRQYWSVLQDVSGSMSDYNEKNQELVDKLSELQEKQSATKEGSTAYKELGAEIASTKDEIAALAAEEEKANKARLFGLIAAKAEMDGFKSISVEALTAIGEQWGVLEKGSGAAASQMISQAEAWTTALEGTNGQLMTIAQMWDNLKKLSKSGITLTATVVSQATGGAMGGQNTSGTCFTGDTLIAMADGSTKHIRDIVPGDVVLSWDTVNWYSVPATIEAVLVHPADEGGRLLLINGIVKVTEEHLLFDGKHWKPAGEFELGHNLVNLDGSLMRVTSVREIVKDEQTYNLHTGHETHNYFANGILAHNAKSVDAVSQATGGQLGGHWALVGDRMGGGFVKGVSELVTPWGQVIDSKTSEKLMKLGLVGDVKSYANAGDDGGGVLNTPPAPVSNKPGTGSKPKPSKVVDMTDSGAAVAMLSDSVDNAAANAQAQANMMNIVTQQVQANMAAMTASFNDGIAAMINTLETTNPRAIGKQVSYELSKAS